MVVLAGVAWSVVDQRKQIPSNVPISPTMTESRQMAIIRKMQNEFSGLQEEIPLEPVLGATRWFGPGDLQFWCDKYVLIHIEDGHVIDSVLYEVTDDQEFVLVEARIEDYYPLAEWQALKDKYAPECEVTNYELDLGEWVKTDKNVFVNN